MNEYILYILPFFNEIANILTLSFSQINIYKHHPETFTEELSKISIDFIALIGIIWNTVYITHKYNNKIYGITKGLVILLISFIIPNLFLKYIIDKININFNLGTTLQDSIIKFIIGIIIILLLVFIEHKLYNFIINYLKKNKYLENKN